MIPAGQLRRSHCWLAVPPLTTDQRGVPRIVDGTVDIGACEYGASALPRPGDANGDGKVDFADLLILAQNYGNTGATFAQGDFDGDGVVDFTDLLILAQNYDRSSTALAVSAMSPGRKRR